MDVLFLAVLFIGVAALTTAVCVFVLGLSA